ncbi:hypothetical protein PCNPT3_07030 [Psychromonas sp. CNPT3]|uniref:vWA domain-containing protein n=1 Tax=Psychromonas sp. CNPT3 TaxID=314282 RepID=UPI00006E3C14|nr:VWA domain-containing protein [Psychromonas sp. CNPT3]AGH81344.1 hypothetical protein PCNPT3_07030 [Psychromonas sp. CNPT3]
MIEFFLHDLELIYPMWLWLLPLPLIITHITPSYRTQQSAIKVPFFAILIDALNISTTQGASQLVATRWQKYLLCFTWIMILFALTKPTLLGPPQVREQIGRDIMVVVDLSGSMQKKDFVNQQGHKISRLDAVKEVLTDFIKTRQGDRLGLILFGDAAFVQTPFTADHDVWLDLLMQTRVNMAGKSTHLGDAIGLTIKRFNEATKNQTSEKTREKVAIILSDGNDTGSYVPPIDAAMVAKVNAVRIYMIAIGDPKSVGEQSLDMQTINKIASVSGGQAYQALNQQELLNAYAKIDKLEPQLYQSTQYRAKKSLHHYLVILVLLVHLLFFAGLLCQRLYLKKVTSKGDADV